MKARIIGIVAIAIGLVLAWIFVLGPLEEARAGAPQVKYSVKSFFAVVMCLAVGLAALLGGPELLAKMSGPPKSREQIIITACVLLVTMGGGGLGWWWFSGKMAALGYTGG